MRHRLALGSGVLNQLTGVVTPVNDTEIYTYLSVLPDGRETTIIDCDGEFHASIVDAIAGGIISNCRYEVFTTPSDYIPAARTITLLSALAEAAGPE